MESILMKTTDELFQMLNEIDDRFKDTHISSYETDYLLDLQTKITTEIKLRELDISYHNCYFRHKNGECAAIGCDCSSNGYGDRLSLCQKNRLIYISETNKSKEHIC